MIIQNNTNYATEVKTDLFHGIPVSKASVV